MGSSSDTKTGNRTTVVVGKRIDGGKPRIKVSPALTGKTTKSK